MDPTGLGNDHTSFTLRADDLYDLYDLYDLFPLHDLDLSGRPDRLLICVICMI